MPLEGSTSPNSIGFRPSNLDRLSEAAQKVGGWVSDRSTRNRLQPPGSSTACKAVSVLCYHLWWPQVSGPLFRGSHFSGRSLSPSASHMCGQPTQQHTGRCLEVPSLARPKCETPEGSLRTTDPSTFVTYWDLS